MVFDEDWYEGYKQAVEKAGLKERGVCFHTLRHTYASFLVKEGVDLPTLQQLMGHADIKTTMRYAHIGQSHVVQSGAKVPSLLDQDRTHSGHEKTAEGFDLGGSA